ncbi:hypothetical protein HYFRA_00011403 [Hymenoscyphus fraxineus]|uniref:Trichothecene 3-O-acetyltransferase-like N-terminal domain-containing protein n=1 Tax=Hymenoscyphus fraxineus TaxID=746836 RepID=A0A9N9L4J6_9HELO|nr:hypothetical protein HYFRA_00011403 [Hymenoscyphus fraxineus]
MDLNDHLDILGQQPGLNIYTQICSCYTVPDASSYSAIVKILENGLSRLSNSFPWTAGQVVNEGASKGNTGIFKIAPLEKTPRLVVKDLRDDPSAPTMDGLREAHFPFRMLDESIIAPRNTIPGTGGADVSDSPVLIVQVTFIVGGLILTFLGQHQTMDGTGQGEVIRLFSKACHGEPFSSEEISTGNMPREDITPLLDDEYKPGPEIEQFLTKPSPAADTPPPKCSWTYFSFDDAALKAIKSLATTTLISGFVSTDDALSAFIWKCVARVRLHRLDPSAISTFARAVNIRSHLGVPQSYPGLVQSMVNSTCTAQELVNDTLGSVASRLRSALDPTTSDLAYKSRALATFLNRSPDKSIVAFTAMVDPSTGIMLSSWAKLDSYDLDFNLGLGPPESVRRPQFFPVESLMYLLPRRADGEIVVAMCLRDEDMVRLRNDEVFTKYGKNIE